MFLTGYFSHEVTGIPIFLVGHPFAGTGKKFIRIISNRNLEPLGLYEFLNIE